MRLSIEQFDILAASGLHHNTIRRHTKTNERRILIHPIYVQTVKLFWETFLTSPEGI